MAALAREHGAVNVLALIIAELDTVNEVTGSGLSEGAVAHCAQLVMDRFRFRTANALRLALRDGLNSGKIFGKLTYPLIAEWLTNHEESVENANFQKHQAAK